MDPLTLTVLAIGSYFGYKKVYPWAKEQVATLQHRVLPQAHVSANPTVQALPFQLDAGLSPAQLAEVSNLLQNVRSAALVRTTSDLYRSQNFPLAAAALDSRARQLGG